MIDYTIVFDETKYPKVREWLLRNGNGYHSSTNATSVTVYDKAFSERLEDAINSMEVDG